MYHKPQDPNAALIERLLPLLGFQLPPIPVRTLLLDVRTGTVGSTLQVTVERQHAVTFRNYAEQMTEVETLPPVGAEATFLLHLPASPAKCPAKCPVAAGTEVREESPVTLLQRQLKLLAAEMGQCPPNASGQSWQDLEQALLGDLLLTGRAVYWKGTADHSKDGKLVAVHRLDPARLLPCDTNSGPVPYQLNPAEDTWLDFFTTGVTHLPRACLWSIQRQLSEVWPAGAAAGVPPAPAPATPAQAVAVCDCGGAVVGGTHSGWCSTQQAQEMP